MFTARRYMVKCQLLAWSYAFFATSRNGIYHLRLIKPEHFVSILKQFALHEYPLCIIHSDSKWYRKTRARERQDWKSNRAMD